VSDFRDVQAITLDAGGTLLKPWPSVGHLYAAVAAEHGVRGLSPRELNQRFMQAWTQLGGRAESRSDWAAIVQATFDQAPPFADPKGFFESLYARFTEPESWHVFEDVLPTLESLRRRNLRLGILSNWDDRLRPLLNRLGLTGYFEVIVVSCEVGHRKPAVEIFQHAARAFGIHPRNLLHVGDSEEHDIAGANQAGAQALGIRRDPLQEDPDWISSLEMLLHKL